MESIDRNKRRLRYGGFTLIELSIVLIIIGLLAGGVLVGQTLITAAQVNREIKEVQDLETQIINFRGKYDCLPGDCASATQFLGTTSSNGYPILNGDGDGTIMSADASHIVGQCMTGGATQSETDQVFVHLNAARLGNYNFTNANGLTPLGYGYYLPHDIFSGAMLVTCLDDSSQAGQSPYMRGTAIVIGGTPVGGGNYNYNTRVFNDMGWGGRAAYIPVAIAEAIDRKIDDGLPQAGRIGYAFVPCTYPASWSTYPQTYSAIMCNVSLLKKLWN